MAVKRSCSATKEDGHPCRANPLSESGFCLLHDPDRAEEVAEARRLGGQRRKRERVVAHAYAFGGLQSVEDIRRLVEVAVLDTFGLENSVARNRTLAYLATTAAKLLEAGELEERVAVLEARLDEAGP